MSKRSSLRQAIYDAFKPGWGGKPHPQLRKRNRREIDWSAHADFQRRLPEYYNSDCYPPDYWHPPTWDWPSDRAPPQYGGPPWDAGGVACEDRKGPDRSRNPGGRWCPRGCEEPGVPKRPGRPGKGRSTSDSSPGYGHMAPPPPRVLTYGASQQRGPHGGASHHIDSQHRPAHYPPVEIAPPYHATIHPSDAHEGTYNPHGEQGEQSPHPTHRLSNQVPLEPRYEGQHVPGESSYRPSRQPSGDVSWHNNQPHGPSYRQRSNRISAPSRPGQPLTASALGHRNGVNGQEEVDPDNGRISEGYFHRASATGF